MHVALRRHLVSVACLGAAGLIGLGAILDHRNETARGSRAQVSEWYCEHQGTRCGGPSSKTIEEHWELRERIYEGAVAGLVGLAVVLFAVRLARR